MPKKQEKKAAKKEPKKKAAPAKTQDPEAERNALTVKLEGDLPYDRNIYVNEVRFLMKQTAEAIIEIGKRLLVIKEKEGFGNFMKVVEEEIGIPHRTATRFMNTAIKAEKFPVIQALATVSKVNKVYTLLEAPEEDLKELEKKGVLAGKDMDELQRMSVKDMRELVKELRSGLNKATQKEMDELQKKNATMKQELDNFNRRYSDNGSAAWVEANRAFIAEKMTPFIDELKVFADNERVFGNDDAHYYLTMLYLQLMTELGTIDARYKKKSGRPFIERKQ